MPRRSILGVIVIDSYHTRSIGRYCSSLIYLYITIIRIAQVFYRIRKVVSFGRISTQVCVIVLYSAYVIGSIVSRTISDSSIVCAKSAKAKILGIAINVTFQR